MIAKRSTVQLDGNFLVMEVIEYVDGWCRCDVILRTTNDPKPNSPGITVMIQKGESKELTVAKIARDFSTFATRALAWLPTVGQLVESYDAGDEDEDENEDE